MHISKEKAVCHENSRIGRWGWTSKSGLSLDQNWMFVDKGERGFGVRILDFFMDVVNEWTLTKFLNEPSPNSWMNPHQIVILFFFLPSFSASS